MTEEDWRQSLNRRMNNVEDRLNSHERDSAVDRERLKNIERDVHDMKGGVTWLNRLIIGALILAVMGFALSGGLGAAL